MRATLSTLRSREEFDAEEAVDGADSGADGFMCLGKGEGRLREAREDSRKGREEVEVPSTRRVSWWRTNKVVYEI